MSHLASHSSISALLLPIPTSTAYPSSYLSKYALSQEKKFNNNLLLSKNFAKTKSKSNNEHHFTKEGHKRTIIEVCCEGMLIV